MGVFFGTTEITGMHFGEQEITEIFFGNTEIFSVWAEYDGTLPAQYNANGDYLADYRIYGSAGAVGDRTVNLFDGTITPGVWTDETMTDVAQPQSKIYVSLRLDLPIGTYTFIFENNVTILRKIVDGVYSQVTARDLKTYIITTSSNTEFGITVMLSSNEDWGNTWIMLTHGSTAPTSYIPYGYKVDMSIKSRNLFDVAQTNNGTDYYAGGLHWEIAGQSVTLSETSNITYPQSFLLDREGNALQLTAGKTYHAKLFVDNAPAGSNIYIFLRKKVAGGWSVVHTISINDAAIVAPTDVEEWAWLLVAQGNGITYTNTKIRLQVSETPIIEYAPYSNTTTPIYIGSSSLGEDEYVDYGEGKIYRMSGGTLTPTDPPVPLPQLPTVDGTNIVDYAGQSAAVPSRFVAKYRKEGF